MQRCIFLNLRQIFLPRFSCAKHIRRTSPRTVHVARRSEGNFLVYYAQEHKQEEEWLFKSALICCREGEDMPKMWKKCSDCNDIPCRDKLANESGRVENVLLRIERREG